MIKPQFDAIEKRFLAHPEMAKLIDELGTSTADAHDLVRGMLHASIPAGSMRKWIPIWAMYPVIDQLKLLLERIIIAIARIRKP